MHGDDRIIPESHVLDFVNMPAPNESPARRAMITSMPKFEVDTTLWSVLIVPALMQNLISNIITSKRIDPAYSSIQAANNTEYRQASHTTSNHRDNIATRNSDNNQSQMSYRAINIQQCPDPPCRAPTNERQLYRCPQPIIGFGGKEKKRASTRNPIIRLFEIFFESIQSRNYPEGHQGQSDRSVDDKMRSHLRTATPFQTLYS